MRYITIIPIFACVLAFIGWAISFVAVVVSSEYAFQLLSAFAGVEIAYNAVLDYWLRMCASVFTLIGILFLMSIWRKYSQLRIILGGFHLMLSVILFIWNCKIGIQSDVQIWDIAFLVVTGIPILLLGYIDQKLRS